MPSRHDASPKRVLTQLDVAVLNQLVRQHLLCRAHHTLTHQIGFTFMRHLNGNLTIHRPDGTRLRWPGERAA